MTKRSFAISAAGLLLLASASCENDVDTGEAGKGLDDQVCTQADVGPNFNHQTAGNFTPANLGGLVDGDGLGKRELENAGIVGGRFVYWKEVVEKPPFEAPIDVVCQVIEFRDATAAAAFATQLQSDMALLRGVVIGLLPEGERVVSEVLSGTGEARATIIQLRGESDAGPLATRISVVTEGPLVRLVLAGTESEGRIGSLSDELAARIRERLDATKKGP